MTSLQIYGLVAPLAIGIIGCALAWWSHHEVLRSEQQEIDHRSRAAE